MRNKLAILCLLLLFTGCDLDGRTYIEQQTDECRAKGGVPMQTYAVYANGLVIGCYFD